MWAAVLAWRRRRCRRWRGRWRVGVPAQLGHSGVDAVQRHAGRALAVVAVTELGDGSGDCRGTGAVEERVAALGRVGAAVVEVHEEGGVAGVACQHLKGEGGEDAAAGGAVVRGGTSAGTLAGVSGEIGKVWARCRRRR